MSVHTGRRALVELSEQYENCERCSLLCTSRRQVVFGSGRSSAPVLIVGEAPGVAEDAEGVPFVGDSGRLLMDLLAKAWPVNDELDTILKVKDEDEYFDRLREYLDGFVFWTNAVMCHPGENRTPSSAEIKNCTERLHRTIYAVDPLLIIGVGKIPVSVLVGKSVAITDKHGTIFDVAVDSPVTESPIRYPMLAVLHPAFLLRQGDQNLVKLRRGHTYDTLCDLKQGFSILEKLHTKAYGRPFTEP